MRVRHWYDGRVKRVTLSLPEELVAFTEGWANERGISRSQAIREALRVFKRAERDRLMAEGYRFYAEESVQMAEEALPAMNEVLPPYDEEKVP